MRDHTIPSEVRLSLYLSARFLQELGLALQLIGVPSVYVRPGIEGVAFPACMWALLRMSSKRGMGRTRRTLNSTNSFVPCRSRSMSSVDAGLTLIRNGGSCGGVTRRY